MIEICSYYGILLKKFFEMFDNPFINSFNILFLSLVWLYSNKLIDFDPVSYTGMKILGVDVPLLLPI